MNEATPVTGEQVRQAMERADISHVDHHECGICGVMVFYSRQGDRLYFSSGCGCSDSPPQERSWDSAADWINMQHDDDAKTKLMHRFGMVPNAEVEVRR